MITVNISCVGTDLKMNFSEVFKQSNQLCKVSPDGKYLVSS